MAFCTNCGHRLPDGAKFCCECGTPVHVSNDDHLTEKTTVYEGKIHRCPNCGDRIDSFVAICPSCSYELRGITSTSILQEFVSKLAQIEELRQTDVYIDVNANRKEHVQNTVNLVDAKKVELIRNFMIPNTKEDLKEFIVLALSNINIERYAYKSGLTASQVAVCDAWEAKLAQAYNKAQLSFGSEPDFCQIEKLYNEKRAEIEIKKRVEQQRNAFGLTLIFGMVVLILVYILFIRG